MLEDRLSTPLALVADDSYRVNVWQELATALNPAFERPSLRPGWEARELRSARGQTYYMLKNRSTRTYLRIAPDEYFVVGLIDGQRTLKDLVFAYFLEYQRFAFDRITHLVAQLRQHWFLTEPPRDAWLGLANQLQRGSRVERAARFLRGFMYREFELVGIDAAVNAAYDRAGRVFFTGLIRYLVLLLAVLGIVLPLTALVWWGMDPLASTGSYGATLASFGAISLVLVSVHESAHALAVKSYGREVHRGGFLTFYCLPAFFVDTSDIWMEPLRPRLIVSAAGVIAVSAVGGVAMVPLVLAPDSTFAPFLLQVGVVALVSNTWNLLPLIEVDGYYLLLDWLDMPLLRARAFAFLRHDLLRKLRTRERFTREERIFAIFGVLAFAYSVYALTGGVYFWLMRLQPVVLEAWNSEDFLARVLLFMLVTGVGASLVVASVQPLERGRRALEAAIARSRGAAAARRTREQFEIRELLAELSFLSQLETSERNHIAEVFHRRKVRAGAYVIREGEAGDAFFIVSGGVAEVVRRDAAGWPRVIGLLRRGDPFGELALLYDQPRLASVRARTDLTLFAVKRPAFDAHVAPAMRAFGVTVAWVEQRSELSRLPLFAGLGASALDRLLTCLCAESFPAGAVILRQGDAGHRFYVIRSGRVRVLRTDTDGITSELNTLGSGAYFGEMALLSDSPRNATVETLEPTAVWSLDREAFDRMLLGESALGERLVAEAERRSQRIAPESLGATR